MSPTLLLLGSLEYTSRDTYYRRVQLEALARLHDWYFVLHAAHLMAQAAFLLHLLNFQPRIGIVTRSLGHASHDLGAFLLMLALVVALYAGAGHVLFGAAVAPFATLPRALDTCFAMLMGDTAVGGALRALPRPLRTVGAIYFWSFMLLVFLVLINFVLAIICDAFCEVKEATEGAPSVWEEVRGLLSDAAARVTGRQRVSTREIGAMLERWADGAERAQQLGDGAAAAPPEAVPLSAVEVHAVLQLRASLAAGKGDGNDDAAQQRLRYMAAWIHRTLRPMKLRDDLAATVQNDPDAPVR